MKYIQNWFHFYDTVESFEIHKNQDVINPNSICFIEETGQVYTQNSFFGIGTGKFEALEKLVLQHQAKINDILGIAGSSVDDKVINNISDLINFLDGFTEGDNLKDFINAIKKALESQITEVNNTITDRIDSLVEAVKLDSESLHNSIDIINGNINSINIRLDGHDTSISAINASIASHIKEYALLKTSYENFKEYATSKFAAIDGSISSLNTSVYNLQQYFNELEDKFDDVENEISNVEALLEDTKKLVQELEDRFGDTLAAIEQYKREINEDIEDFKDLLGSPYGIAPLDGDAKVPSAYLPSYVDDVLEYATKGAFPVTGESGKIYVALDDNLTYRWSGSTYIEISKSLGLGETATTAYPGNKGKKNADDIAEHKGNTNNPHNVTKAQLGLDKVNNTADIDKPISNAQQAALDVLTNSLDEHVSDQANPHNVTKAQVGLGNVDNTSDADKPISTAQAAAIKAVQDDISAHKNSKSNPHEVTKNQVGLGNVDNTSDVDKPISNAQKAAIDNIKTVAESHINNASNPHGVTKGQVGLGNADNTSDLDKPISTATQAALDVLTNSVDAHIADQANPHNITKNQIGLGNVDNTADKDKPISDAAQDLFETKVDKILGKGLSTNDFTNEDKAKLDSSMSIRKYTSEEVDSITSKNVGDIIYLTDFAMYTYWDGAAWKTIGTLEWIDSEWIEPMFKELDGKISNKVDKVEGMGLSANDFSDTYKARLDNLSSITEEELNELLD